MRVSILIPTFNRRMFLVEALESARHQSASAFEILVSDDGSTDGTREYVTGVATQDSRVRLLTGNPSPGIFTNMNFLIRQCEGDAFCILGDDDRLDREYLARLCEPLTSNPAVAASFCDHRIISTDGQTLAEASAQSSDKWGRSILPEGIVADPITVALAQSMCIGFSLYRSRIFKNEAFDLECGGAADVDYSIRAARIGGLYYVRGCLGDYRRHPGTATTTKARFLAEGMIHALGKYRFAISLHEKARRHLLRSVLLSHAAMVSPYDGRRALGSVRRFVETGGSPLHPRLIASVLVALTPPSLAERTRDVLKSMDRAFHRHSGASPNNSDTTRSRSSRRESP
jgi:glycosyltransferase involved in cell wall biosynthesis